MDSYRVDSPCVQFNSKTDTLLSTTVYRSSRVELQGPDGKLRVIPTEQRLTFKTGCKVPRVGCMLIGWGGNNGSTVTASVLANKLKLTWRTKEGVKVTCIATQNSVPIIMCTVVLVRVHTVRRAN